jgi:glycerophosphoryl diester phosphodiesterase
MPNADLRSSSPKLCAHRGLSVTCPENTLPAFGAAIALGVHELEYDLWLSRDGVPVVCHDPSVDRTTDGKGSITGLDWADIRTLDAGICSGDAWRGVRIPRFEEVVDFVQGRCGHNIHIKSPGPGGQLVKLVADAIRRMGLTNVAYIAGEEDVLEAAVAIAPDIPRACLAHQEDPCRMLRTGLQFRCERLQFGRNVTQEHTRQAHEVGLRCNLFWSDEPEDAWRFVEQGIEVVLTNAANALIAGGFPTLQAS